MNCKASFEPTLDYVVSKIEDLVGIVTSIIGIGTEEAPTIDYGVMLEPDACALDIRRIWKNICFDITRGGNSKSVQSGKIYYDSDWNLKEGLLKNPEEVQQTITTLDYSFDIARAVVNNCTWGGYPAGNKINVSNAEYDNITGIVTITASGHGLNVNDPVKLQNMEFSCPSGPTILTYPSGTFGYVFPVLDVIDANTFSTVVGQSTLPHTYTSGGTIQKYQNFQNG